MKILHITTVRSGSTGRTALDLREISKSNGDQYIIAYSEMDSQPQDGDILIGNRIDHLLHAFLSRLLGLQGYFSYLATRRFLRRVKSYNPDIVQLGNLHSNYINLPLLFRYLAKERIPVIMILHDCWFFTGKCTHFTSRGCLKWQIECQSCPAKSYDNKSWIFDFSRKMYNDKRNWYNSLKSLTVIAVSDWEKKQAEQSPLFVNANIFRVYNWIDTDLFKPATPEHIALNLKKYHLSSDCNYIITVGAGWVRSSSKTKDAIQLASRLPSKYRLIVVGRGDDNVFPPNIIRIPYTSDTCELAVLYSLADAYIHFSVEDTFGKVIAEAMACETVPIVFNSTACPETASPYGIIVPPHDIDAIVSAIPLASEIERRRKVRNYVIENYSCPLNLEKYWQS